MREVSVRTLSNITLPLARQSRARGRVFYIYASCSDDDDENGGSNGSKVSIKVEGQTATFGYVYWNIDDENSSLSNGKHYYQLEFWDFNFYAGKLPKKMSMFYLGFLADGSTDALPTGTFNDYDLSGGLNFSQSDEEGTYIEGDRSKSGNLVITKDGNNYTITIEPLYIISGEEDDDNISNTTTTLTSLKYTGSIPKAPKKSWED